MKTSAIAWMLASLLAAPVAYAEVQDCSTKREAIEHQLQYAKQYGDNGRIAGLQKALDEVSAHCTPEGQRDQAREQLQKAQERSRHANQDVAKAEQRLRDAQARGDADDIAKARRKLAEKQAKWQDRQDDAHRAEAAARSL